MPKAPKKTAAADIMKAAMAPAAAPDADADAKQKRLEMIRAVAAKRKK